MRFISLHSGLNKIYSQKKGFENEFNWSIRCRHMGNALARMLSNSGQDVTVWSAIKKEIDDLSSTRCHPNLPDMIIPDTIVFTKSIEEVCVQKDIILFCSSFCFCS